MRLASTLLAALACALAAAPAHAEVTRKKSIWGPLTYNGASAFGIYEDLGVGIYQMGLAWSTVAPVKPRRPRDPSDPAYQWPTDVDQAVADATPRGIRVAVLVTATPAWANKGRPTNWAPQDPRNYARFMAAAAKRYPRVRLWMVWGEPTRRANFLPNPKAAEAQAPAEPTRKRTEGARRYAQILDAAYAALKGVRRSNRVIGGMSFVTGDVGPQNWIRYVRLPDGRPPRMDMWGHNPFGPREPDLRRPQLAPGLADFSDLDLVARWLDRYQRRGSRRLPLFLSEYQIPTDRPNFEFNFYTDRATQARFLASAMRIVRGWSRLYTLGYHTLVDDPPNGRGDEVLRGLIDQNGEHKPGYDAFKQG